MISFPFFLLPLPPFCACPPPPPLPLHSVCLAMFSYSLFCYPCHNVIVINTIFVVMLLSSASAAAVSSSTPASSSSNSCFSWPSLHLCFFFSSSLYVFFIFFLFYILLPTPPLPLACSVLFFSLFCCFSIPITQCSVSCIIKHLECRSPIVLLL